MITQAELKRLLHYNEDNGRFTCLVQRGDLKVGDVAGGENGDGYVRIKIFCVKYLAHRLAWFYMKGVWPTDQVDHENTIRNDNHWENLRDATNSINTQNQRKAHSDSKSGFLGVSQYRKGFRAKIGVNYKTHCLGVHSTPQLAYAEYLKAKREQHEGCTL